MGKSNNSFGKKTRKDAGHNSKPTYAIIDSQSVKTTFASEDRGIDGGKKVKGHKRHIVVDTMGNLLAITVHAAKSMTQNQALIQLEKRLKNIKQSKNFAEMLVIENPLRRLF